MSKTATAKLEKAKMINFLAKSDAFVERATLALYERQTATEKAVGAATVDNNRGFSGAHAEIMTKLAEWIINSRRAEGQRLTPKQRNVARRILCHYTTQLIQIRDERKGVQLPLANIA